MKKTGNILREAREKKGISIYEISTATKINTKNIMAMEEGAIDRLPPKTFLRGFVASYANFLQLDTNEILKVFFEEMGSTRPEVQVRDHVTGEMQKTDNLREHSRDRENDKNKNKNKTDKSAVASLTDNKKVGYFKIYGIVGIIILIVIIGIIKRKIDSYESEAITQTTTPEMNAADSPKPSASPTPNSNSSASPTTNLAGAIVTSSPSATPNTSASPTATATPTPAPTATPTPTPKPTSAAGTTTPAASPSPSPTPGGRPQEVVIEALNDVDVVIQVDNEAAKKMTLHHDEVQSIKARRKVSMKFSDGGAVNLTVNGKDKGVPGDLGKPKKVDLP